MKKPTTTAIYSLLVMLVFLGLSASIQSCGGKKKDVEATAEELADKAENLANSYSEDEYFEEDGDTADASGENATDASSSTASSASNVTERSYSSSSSSSSSASSSSYSSAPYLVVAGNYLLIDNAEQMVSDLKKKGYSGSEKVVFDLSQYHTVIAGRYSSRSAATTASNELKRAGVDTYVIKKK